MARLMIQQAVGLCGDCQRPYTLGEFERLAVPDLDVPDRATCPCGGLVVVARSLDLEERDLWVTWESYLAAHPRTARRPVLMVSSRWEAWRLQYGRAAASFVALALLLGIAVASLWWGP